MTIDSHPATYKIVVLLLCSLTILLPGCTIQPPPATSGTIQPAPSTPATSDTTASTESDQPIDMETCTAVQSEVSSELGVDVTLEAEAPFQDIVGGAVGSSCQLSATGTGETFTNFVDVATQLVTLLEDQGWVQDPQYAADSPTGTIVGLRRNTNGEELAAVQVGWDPAPGVECPPDEPIATCAEELEPEQMLYTITIDLVTRSQ